MSATHRRPADFPATPRRLVVAVAAGVLLVHLAIVALVPLHRPAPAPDAISFITQAIEVAPPPPAPVPPPRAAPAPHPKPAPAPPRHRAAPKPAAAHALPLPLPAPEPSPVAAAPAPDAAAVVAAVEAASAPAQDARPGSAGGTGSAADSAGAAAGGLPAAGKSAQVHAPVRLSFALSGLRGGVQPWSGAFGDLTWRQDGNAYSAELALKIFFRTIRRQTSSGRVTAQGIAPDRFTDARKNESTALLQRDSGQVLFSSGAPAAPLRPGAQDRLSVVMQLGALIAGDPARYTPGSEIAIETIGPRDAETWVFTVGPEETVSVPAGQFTARRLRRQARHPGDYALDLWLAPAQGYLPVQMRQTEPDGDVFDLQLREISQS